MLLARAAVGFGEAGYGRSVRPCWRRCSRRRACRLSSAPSRPRPCSARCSAWWPRRHRRAARLAGPFLWVGGASLLLVVLFPLLVREAPRTAARAALQPRALLRQAMREVMATRSARLTYVASGLQMLVLAAIGAWMPTFLAREYGLAADQAAAHAGLLFLLVAVA